MYAEGDIIWSTPPATAISKFPMRSPLTAWSMAASDVAQAASTAKLVPCKSNTLATRPGMTLASSPGMESSVIGVNFSRTPASISSSIFCASDGAKDLKADVFLRISYKNGRFKRVLDISFFMPPIELPIITAVRLWSNSFLSYPASSSAMRVVSTARCCTVSICLATCGGMRYLMELNLKDCGIKPPILE